MTPDSRKTTAILCAAGALVAAALLLQKATAAGRTDSPTASNPLPVADPAADPPVAPNRCDAATAASSRTSVAMAGGRAGAGLSAGKILRGSGGQIFASLDLSAPEAPTGTRQPLNVALVIDRSGSMEGDKLRYAKQAAIALIDRLGAGDRIALVQYDDSAQVVVPSTRVDAEGKATLRRAVDGLTVGGSTNLHGGMSLGRDEVQRTLESGQVSRVILLSDGLANAGEVNPTAIADAARSAADRGVRITSVGVGNDYNEDLMEAIAESGRGHYYYVNDAAGLEKVLGGELRAAQATVATRVELRLRPACAGVEIDQVFGYDMRRDGDALVIPMADLFGGDSRKLLTQLRVPDRTAGALGVLTAELRYRDVRSGKDVTARLELGVEVTDDYIAAQNSVDRDVMAMVLKAQAADTIRRAAAAYQKGDSAGAASMLQAEGMRMAKEADRYHLDPAATAPAMSSMNDFSAAAQSAPADSDEGKAALKKTKSEARGLSKGR